MRIRSVSATLSVGVVVSVAVIAVGGLFAAGAGATQCAAPSARVTPDHAGPGGTFTVHGDGFTAGCPDTVVCTPGGPCKPPPPPPPTKNIPITFVQGSRTWRLGTAHGHSFSRRFVVPASANIGPASIKVGGECGGNTCVLPFRVTLAGTGSPSGSLSLAGLTAIALGLALLAASRRLQR
jgi:hypothetical protein